jgi:hypothetical protein
MLHRCPFLLISILTIDFRSESRLEKPNMGESYAPNLQSQGKMSNHATNIRKKHDVQDHLHSQRLTIVD